MYKFSKWQFLFSSLVLVRIAKAVAKCFFSIMINVCNELERSLKSDRNSSYHKASPGIERNSVKDCGLSNRGSDTSNSDNQSTNPAYVDCLISGLPVGKKVTVRRLNKLEVETNFTDVLCNDPNNSQSRTVTVDKMDDKVLLQLNNNVLVRIQWSSTSLDYTRMTTKNTNISHKRNTNKLSQKYARSSHHAEQVIKQCKDKVFKSAAGRSCFKTKSSDKIDKLNESNNYENKFSESVSLNSPPSIVECNPKSPSKNGENLRSENGYHENKTVQSSEKPCFKDFKCNNLSDSAEQNAFQQHSNTSDNQLEGDCPGNPTLEVQHCDKAEQSAFQRHSNASKNQLEGYCQENPTISDLHCDKAEQNAFQWHYNAIFNDNQLEGDCPGNPTLDDLHCEKAEQSAFQRHSNASKNQLEGYSQENPTIEDLHCDEEVRLFRETSEIPDQRQNLTKREGTEIPPLITKKEEVKLSSSQTDSSMASCSNIHNCENTEVTPNKLEKNLVNFEFNDTAVSVHSIKDNNLHRDLLKLDNNISTDGSISLTPDTCNEILEKNYRNYKTFLGKIRPTLDKIESNIINICKLSYYKSEISNNKEMREIQSQLKDIVRDSKTVNSEFYHKKFVFYERKVVYLLISMLVYCRQQETSGTKRMKLPLYLIQLTRSLIENRDILCEGDKALLLQEEEFINTLKMRLKLEKKKQRH